MVMTSAASSNSPDDQKTHDHGFGTGTGGLMGRMSFVSATVGAFVRGGMMSAELEAMAQPCMRRRSRVSKNLPSAAA
jgi:hypothetical protein